MNIKIDLPADFLDEEVRWDYTITPQMKKVWAVELDLVCEFNRVCKKHGLKYYACAGTALGVERHKGFIPWDDDVDLMMLREDYDKLLTLYDEFKEPYFLQHQSTDRAFMFGFAKLQNIMTTALEQPQSPSHQGIFIDIFPIDNIPDDTHLLEMQVKALTTKLRKMQIMINSTYNYYPYAENKTKFYLKKIVHLLFRYLKFFTNSGYNKSKEFEDECRRYNEIETEKVSMLGFSATDNRFYIKKELYKDFIWKDFEFIKIPCLKNNHDYLTQLFGDFMKPVRGGSYHEGILFDTDKPYTSYIKNY